MSGGVVVCDLDGVVYLGDTAVPGAGVALARIEELGWAVLFCTNNSSRRLDETASKVERLTGYRARPAQVLSSATAAARLVAGEARTAYVLGGAGIREALEQSGVEVTGRWQEADHVIVGLDRGLDYLKLADAVSAVRSGARLVATNHDPTYPTPGRLLPGAGAIVAAVERASGTTAVYAGKPNPPMRRLVAERAGGRRVWVAGDRPDTDLAMAHAEGWTSVLVLTGVTDDPSSVTPPPDLVVASLADLPAALPQ